MGTFPLVTIIVPVYNAETWLQTCVDSLLAQTYPCIEIILVDDGSTDSSGLICKWYSSKHENLIHIQQSNLGVSTARNTGILNASGSYILFVDSDDWVGPQHVDSLVKEAERTHADYVLSGYVRNLIATKTKDIIIPEAMTFDVTDTDAEERFLSLFESRLLYSPVTGLYRKSIICSNKILFPKAIHYGEDRIFNLNYLCLCNHISSIHEAHYHYRIENDDSLSHIQEEDELLHARRLFAANKNFLNTMQYNSNAFLSWLYTPIFDAYSNRIMRFASLFPRATWREAYAAIKNYLNAKDLCEGYAYASLDKYPRFLVLLMKYHCAFLLTILSFRNRKRPL